MSDARPELHLRHVILPWAQPDHRLDADHIAARVRAQGRAWFLARRCKQRRPDPRWGQRRGRSRDSGDLRHGALRAQGSRAGRSPARPSPCLGLLAALALRLSRSPSSWAGASSPSPPGREACHRQGAWRGRRRRLSDGRSEAQAQGADGRNRRCPRCTWECSTIPRRPSTT